MVSGGDVLVEIKLPPAASTQALRVMLNGRDVSRVFRENPTRRSLTGLVDGLGDGRNSLVAKAGSSSATLELTNYPITGPIVSGEHLKPFTCLTVESGLGEPLDADCSARTKVEYFYRPNATPEGSFIPLADPTGRPSELAQTTTSHGKTVPYIVRLESGTINRAIYRIAILEGEVWNRRIVYSFGGGCGANYNQGRSAATSALLDPLLSRGFAHIISTQNVMQQHCNDNLSGEALMMIKEHFIKRYGVPEWTMGIGGSGGSIQQLLIAQNFPGLLDGLLPSLTFPGSMTVRSGVTDCRLLLKLYNSHPAAWPQEKRTAVEGYGTCNAWNRSFVDVPRQQPHPDLRSGWKIPGRMEAVRTPQRIFIDSNDIIYVTDCEPTDRDGYGHNPGWRRGIRVGSAKDGSVTAFIPDPKESQRMSRGTSTAPRSDSEM
jgi:hypothetical protein